MSERAEYWRRMLADWAAAGLSQAEFCRRRELKGVTFAWWKRRLQGGDGGRPVRTEHRPRRTGRGAFVELALPSGLPPAGTIYELGLPGGVCLRLPANFDVARVARLVHALVASC